MIAEAIANYVFQRVFLYQLITSLTVYITILTVRFYIIRHRRYQLFKYYGIPGPKQSMLDGNTSMYYKNNRMFEVEMEYSKKYGPYWASFHGDWPFLNTTDPALIRHVFLENFNVFTDRTKAWMDIIMTSGIFFAPRPRWKVFRRIFAASLNRFAGKGDTSAQFIEDCVKLMVDYIDKEIEVANKKGMHADINLYDLMKSNALYMISELALKIKIEVKENEPNVKQLDDHMKKLDGLLVRLALAFPFLVNMIAWFSNTLQIHGYMKVIYNSLEDRLSTTTKRLRQEKKDGLTSIPADEPIVDTLIRHLNANQMTHREYLGNVEAILLAGYDTTATALIHTLWCISKYPEVQQRLREDVMTHGTESRYLEQVLNESLRLYHPGPSFITRIATKSSRFNNLVIPEETVVVYNTYIMHRNPAYWKDPEKFDPERFVDGIEIDPAYYAPFGLGERKCPGYKLSLLEMKLILTELVLRYKLTLVSPQKLEMCTLAFTLAHPVDDIKIKLEKRKTGRRLSLFE